jgi:hypothetical protein
LAVTFLLVPCLLASAQAAAAPFEPAGHFGGILPPVPPPKTPSEFPEEAQLGGSGGMAVNISGAGGVAPGTLYVATRGPSGEATLRIARFEPKGSGMAFVGGWEVTKNEGPYERCGTPMLLPKCPTRPEAAPGGVDLEVDQETGNVYVFSVESLAAENLAIAVFKADGSEVLGRFAKKALGSVTTASTKAEVHQSAAPGGLAVGNNGTVYLFDLNSFDNFYHRLMTFKEATPGDPKTYAYVEGADIGAGFLGEGEYPARPVADAAGDIYVAGETYVEKYTPSQPKPAICKFEFAPGGIKAMTVNRETGEPFFYTSADKKVHRLSACSGGKFSELANTKMEVAPERDNIFALAFDPVRELAITRGPGALYGSAPSSVPSTSGKGEPGMGALGYVFAPAEKANPPVVESEGFSKVGTASVELEAHANPKGALTSYTFQYMTNTAYLEDGETFGAGAIEAPSPPAILGAGQKSLRASLFLTGLSPGTAYRFRVIVQSECEGPKPEPICEAIGATKAFTTFATAAGGLADARAYELVSPAQKNGGQVLPAEPLLSSCGLVECKPGSGFNHFPMQSAPDGNTVVYEGTPFSANNEGSTLENQYISRRTENGWVAANPTPALLQSKGGQGYKAFNRSLSEGILEQIEPSFGPPAPTNFANLYLQSTTSPFGLTPLVTEEPENRVPGAGSNSFKVTYATASADFKHQIFEANDALTPEAEHPADSEKENNLYEWTAGQLRLINIEPDESTEAGAQLGSGTLLKSGNPNSPSSVLDGAISADGRRIFWTSKSGQLFIREDGQSTVKVEDPGKFLVASADGSQVLLSNGCLYLVAPQSCVDLTQGAGGFLGLAGRSDDLSHIYFADSAVLTEEANSHGDKAVAGKPNLYGYVEGTTRFIATLLGADSDDFQASPAVRSAEASPAGRYLAFQSTAQLTGVPNVGLCQINGETNETENAPCSEVFLYDSATQTLLCPSCNPTNSAPLGLSVLRLIKGAQGFLTQPRYLTDSGRLYFDSRDSLTLSDTNGVEDVYQYEPQDLGSCADKSGCVSLISDGRGGSDANFLSVDEKGENVFFTTRNTLLPADRDQLIDLYDARVGGGIPEPPPPPVCSGEACQPPTPVPAQSTPAPPPSGAGNYKPPKCRKGQVRRAGKCVKKPKQKKANKSKAKQQGGSK